MAVGVEQFDTLTISSKGEGSLVTCDALIGKVLEDLLKGCLCHTVLLNAKVSLFSLEATEEPANSLVLLWHSQLEVLTALL